MVRHGESIWNKDSKFTGWTNIPLTEAGRKEAATIAKTLFAQKLCPTVVFTSVLERAIETSNIIKTEISHAYPGLSETPVYTSWRLNERHYGTLEGVPRKYVRDMFGKKFTKLIRCHYNMKPPVIRDYPSSQEYKVYRNCYFEKVKYGESKENVLERVLPYYENDILYTLSENKLPLIVTHKHTARVIMKHLLKINDHDFEHYELPDKKICVVYLDDELRYEHHDEIEYRKDT